MMRMTSSITVLSILAATATGCAATGPSDQLVDARRAVAEAADGRANQLEPEHVLRAKDALSEAEEAHDDEPQSTEERHLAYLAEREAQLAMTIADTTYARQKKARGQAEYTDLLQRGRQQAQARANEAQQEARSASERAEEAQEEASKTQAELAEERRARREAEQRLAATKNRLDTALSELSATSQVERKKKELIITLNGAVLFELGKSQLMPIAKEKLAEVAAALKEEQKGRTIVIEGHTDAQGTEVYNDRLSQARAEAVRRYLIERGVDGSRIKAKGMGESDPVATNKTPEGRANNRRVEIIIRDTKDSSSNDPSSESMKQ